jgi:hypothetical protein
MQITKKICPCFNTPPAMSGLDYLLNSEAGEVAVHSRRLAYPTSGNMLLVLPGVLKVRKFKFMKVT